MKAGLLIVLALMMLGAGRVVAQPDDDLLPLDTSYRELETNIRFDYPADWVVQPTSQTSFMVANNADLLDDPFSNPLGEDDFLLEISLVDRAFFGFDNLPADEDDAMEALVEAVVMGMAQAYAEDDDLAFGKPFGLQVEDQWLGMASLKDQYGEGLVLVRGIEETIVILVGRAGSGGFDPFADVMLRMMDTIALEPSGFPG